MIRRNRHKRKEDAELNITSFMNLMIVLVPVLLMMTVFSHITVLELKLPQAASEPAKQDLENKDLELLVRPERIEILYPRGFLVKEIGKKDDVYDYKLLQQALKEIKQMLSDKGVEKKEITLLVEPNTDYQTIVSIMDHTRSYKAVVAASLVDAELFPNISLGDAPPDLQGGQAQ